MQKTIRKPDHIDDILRKHLPVGACERALICPQATEKCRHDIFFENPEDQKYLRCTPEKRWIDCYAYKQQLGLMFDAEIGVYVLPEYRETLLTRKRLITLGIK